MTQAAKVALIREMAVASVLLDEGQKLSIFDGDEKIATIRKQIWDKENEPFETAVQRAQLSLVLVLSDN